MGFLGEFLGDYLGSYLGASGTSTLAAARPSSGYLGSFLGSYLGSYLGRLNTLRSEAYARMMSALLPPGRVWRLIGSSVLVDVLTASAYELARVEARAADLVREDDPARAVELLPEYEAELDLASDGTDEERSARIVAHLVARQRYRPADFQAALATLLGQDAADVVVIERSRADAVAMADDREIFRFFVYRNPALPGTYYLDSAQALVDKIKPSHTVGHVIESIDMLCDDPFSLCDRDILGA